MYMSAEFLLARVCQWKVIKLSKLYLKMKKFKFVKHFEIAARSITLPSQLILICSKS